MQQYNIGEIPIHCLRWALGITRRARGPTVIPRVVTMFVAHAAVAVILPTTNIKPTKFQIGVALI
jgi:hypothetical protein